MSFTAESTTQEVIAGKDLSGKYAMVTGCSGGIGLETARALAGAGASLIMANRDSEKSREAASQLKSELPDAEISSLDVNLASFKSVRSFTEEYLQNYPALHLLINNAGVMACPQGETEDGFEMQFGVNHLGHFLLACRLVPMLKDSAPARVVNVSSGGHRRSNVNLEDPNYKKRPYDKWEAYGQSKTANILFSLELNRRLSSSGVLAFSLHPGMIFTDLSRHLTEKDMEDLAKRMPKDDDGSVKMKPKSVPAGAATTVWAATAPELESEGGAYLEDCGLSRPNEGENDPFGYRPYAKDTELAKRLWELSEELVGEKFDF